MKQKARRQRHSVKDKRKKNPPSTCEGVELVPLLLLMPHFLMLTIRLRNIMLPFVGGVTGVGIWDDAKAEAAVLDKEVVAKVKSWVRNGGVGSRTCWWGYS
jgi:hypothetical protein